MTPHFADDELGKRLLSYIQVKKGMVPGNISQERAGLRVRHVFGAQILMYFNSWTLQNPNYFLTISATQIQAKLISEMPQSLFTENENCVRLFVLSCQVENLLHMKD